MIRARADYTARKVSGGDEEESGRSSGKRGRSRSEE